MIKVTSPKNGCIWTCTTRKEAASAALCSVGRIGEIIKSGKTTTLRSGYIVEPVAATPFWIHDSVAPKAEALKVAELIQKQAQYRDDYSNERSACEYEEWKQYFCESTETAFAAQVLDILD